MEKYRPLQHSINVPDNSQREMVTTDLIEKDDDEQEKLRQEQCGPQDEYEPTQKIIRQNLSGCAVLTGCEMIDLMRQSLREQHEREEAKKERDVERKRKWAQKMLLEQERQKKEERERIKREKNEQQK